MSRACIRGGAACDLSLEAKEKPVRSGGEADRLVDAEGGCVQGTMLVARLLSGDEANFSLRRPDRSRARLRPPYA